MLYAFDGVSGANPWDSLTLVSVDGKPSLFGRTKFGGHSWSAAHPREQPGGGVIFRLPLDGEQAAASYSFTDAPSGSTAGYQPHHDSMLQIGSFLYGTTLNSGGFSVEGNQGNGVIFKLDPVSMAYTAIHNFGELSSGGPDGANSHSNFALSNDGSLLYGATALGGANGRGTIYAFDLASARETPLYSFSDATGSEQHGRPTIVNVQGRDILLGMTQMGGVSNNGVIYVYDTAPGLKAPYTPAHFFRGAPMDGAVPEHGNLLITSGGPSLANSAPEVVAYGLTSMGGQANAGVLFRCAITLSSPPRAEIRIMHDFGAGEVFNLERGTRTRDAKQPHGSLILVNGWLYGMGAGGGAFGGGAIFRARPDLACSGSCYELIASFDTSIPNAACERQHPTPTTCDFTGSVPIDNLIASSDGRILYGMTSSGGKFDPANSQQDTSFGTVFALSVPP